MDINYQTMLPTKKELGNLVMASEFNCEPPNQNAKLPSFIFELDSSTSIGIACLLLYLTYVYMPSLILDEPLVLL